jgi:hypothetical protein
VSEVFSISHTAVAFGISGIVMVEFLARRAGRDDPPPRSQFDIESTPRPVKAQGGMKGRGET